MQPNTKPDKTIREGFLPYALPSIGEEEIAEVVDSLRSGWITTGPKTKRFESEFAEYVGSSNALAVNSCTAGLHIALTALGVGSGDEVIVPTFTFCSTANVVVHLGARPVLVDVQDDFNVSPGAIEAAITPRTKAIMPVHYGGQACDLAEIYEIATRYNLPVIEDGAHAIGSSYHGHKIGSDILHNSLMKKTDQRVRSVTVFSFYAIKNMTTGEGGMITTDDTELAQVMRLLSLHGMSRDAWKRYTSAGSWFYEIVMPGYKANMTDIQAAMGIHQLRKLDDFISKRQHIAQLYEQAFADLPEIKTPLVISDRTHVYHLYAIRLELERMAIGRDSFIEELKAHNIGTSLHFIPVHLHPFYQDRFGYRRDDFPMAEAIYDRIFSLPLYPRMTDEDTRDVIRAVRQILTIDRRKSDDT
jgi:dTDP-4-amino-4,6-dideoxygalactose transaminase